MSNTYFYDSNHNRIGVTRANPLTRNDVLNSINPRQLTDIAYVNIGSIVSSLGSGCFAGCRGLTELPTLAVGSTINTFPSNCFYGCIGLTVITIPTNITSLDSNCFYYCINLNQLIFANSQNILVVGSQAFDGTATGIIVSYYNAANFEELPNSLKNSQNQFTNPTYIYYPYIYPEPPNQQIIRKLITYNI